MIIFLTILNSMFMVIGQIMWKLGVIGKEINSVSQLLKLFLNPFIILGIAIYVFATGLWLYILNKGELSYVYPLQSISYIFALMAGLTIFKENLTASKLIGVCLICLGVVMLARK
ncbi:EamA family transporter [Carboxydocella sp. ULO1]|uniref:EamA family transporter n=1 Tax=Carboxydocella sp. ULO1 TaxID=1926599 RepID=UPI0009ADAE5F|nr:EamA family transporter [Carboxydocella sp. ULO1]GAW29471.1 transporter [Carboxydocella sp. ULO1]